MMAVTWTNVFNVFKLLSVVWFLFRVVAVEFGIMPTPEHVAQTAYLALAFVVLREVKS